MLISRVITGLKQPLVSFKISFEGSELRILHCWYKSFKRKRLFLLFVIFLINILTVLQNYSLRSIKRYFFMVLWASRTRHIFTYKSFKRKRLFLLFVTFLTNILTVLQNYSLPSIKRYFSMVLWASRTRHIFIAFMAE